MAEEVLSFLTAKSVETTLQVGGTQSWVLNRARARACRYAILCRNAHSPCVEGDEPHHTAFMVGRIKDIVPSTESEGRWLVLFSEYALCRVPEQWAGRNPVAYWTTDNYPHIDFSALEFRPMPGSEGSVAPPAPARGHVPLTLAEAKAGLGLTFNLPPSAIEITIRA